MKKKVRVHFTNEIEMKTGNCQQTGEQQSITTKYARKKNNTVDCVLHRNSNAVRSSDCIFLISSAS